MSSNLNLCLPNQLAEVTNSISYTFRLKGNARLSWNTATLEFTEVVICRFFKISVLKNFKIFTERNLCWFPESLQLYQKETPKQVFSCKCCKIVKNSFLYRTPLMAASGFLTKYAENRKSFLSRVFLRNFLAIIS